MVSLPQHLNRKMSMGLKWGSVGGGMLRITVVAQRRGKYHNTKWFLMWVPVYFLCVQAVIGWPELLRLLTGLLVFVDLHNWTEQDSSNVLRDFLNQLIFVFLNDILIISKNFIDHHNYVFQVQRQLENRLCVNMRQVHWICDFSWIHYQKWTGEGRPSPGLQPFDAQQRWFSLTPLIRFTVYEQCSCSNGKAKCIRVAFSCLFYLCPK